MQSQQAELFLSSNIWILTSLFLLLSHLTPIFTVSCGRAVILGLYAVCGIQCAFRVDMFLHVCYHMFMALPQDTTQCTLGQVCSVFFHLTHDIWNIVLAVRWLSPLFLHFYLYCSHRWLYCTALLFMADFLLLLLFLLLCLAKLACFSLQLRGKSA